MQMLSAEERRQWIFALNSWNNDEKDMLILVDSGSMIHCCPPDFFPKASVTKSYELDIRAASGERLEHLGRKTVSLKSMRNEFLTITFEVGRVTRPILSVHQLLTKGYQVTFGEESYISKSDCYLTLERIGSESRAATTTKSTAWRPSTPRGRRTTSCRSWRTRSCRTRRWELSEKCGDRRSRRRSREGDTYLSTSPTRTGARSASVLELWDHSIVDETPRRG